VKIGLLALQGAVEPHARSLTRLGATPVMVRRAEHLEEVSALVLPGGESTTISMLLERQQLFEPLAARLAAGMPALGTCAGMILLAAEVLDGRPDQRSFGAIDLTVRRNGYGRQLDSFETELAVAGLDAPFHGVFIRAPRVDVAGPAVEVLASHGGDPVLVRQGRIMAASFHPELTGDTRLHERFVELVASARDLDDDTDSDTER
jgi:5'-phosphate synthase pdxT subunit